MNRRMLMKGLGTALLSGSAASLAAPAIAQGVRELKMVTSWPRNLPGAGTVAQRLADTVTTMSDGRLRVMVYAAGELVPPLEVFDAVSEGAADLYHSADYYFAGKHGAYHFFTGVPFGMTAAEHTAWINHGGGQALWDELSAGFGIKPLLCGNTGIQSAGWFSQPLAGLDSVKGLNFRTPGLAGEVWRRLGVNVVMTPAGEIFAALQSGVIDGAEWIGPWGDIPLGLHRVAKYCYLPSPLEPSAAVCFGVGLGVWESLSETDRTLFRAAAALTDQVASSEAAFFNAESVEALVREHGVTLAPLPDDIVAEMARLAPAVVDSAVTDDLGRRVRDSYMAALDRRAAWTVRADGGYIAARRRMPD